MEEHILYLLNKKDITCYEFIIDSDTMNTAHINLLPLLESFFNQGNWSELSNVLNPKLFTAVDSEYDLSHVIYSINTRCIVNIISYQFQGINCFTSPS